MSIPKLTVLDLHKVLTGCNPYAEVGYNMIPAIKRFELTLNSVPIIWQDLNTGEWHIQGELT